MTSITETAVAALQDAGLSEYRSRAMPVLDRLERREQDIADRLIEFATANTSVGREQVWAIFDSLGMRYTRIGETVQPQAVDGSDADQVRELRAALMTLTEQVSRLTQAARARGLDV